MKSIVLEAPGRLSLHDTVPPMAPGVGEALVRVRCVGVCGTDLHAFRGTQSFLRYPVVLGHELAVEVVELGPAAPGAERDDLRPGARCAVLPYLSDGSCPACRAGRRNCCATLQVLGVHVDGGMRERLLVPRANLLRADDLSDTALALVEMLAVGAHAARRGGVRSGERVLVLGAGPIGLAVMVFATAAGAHVEVSDLDHGRAATALRLGVARTALRAEPDDHAEATMVDGRPFDVVVDATGSRAAMERAPRLVGIGGRVVYVGHTRGELRFDNPTLHAKELTLVFSRNATREDFEMALTALRQGAVDADAWVTDRAGPDDVAELLPRWVEGAPPATKAVVDWPRPARPDADRSDLDPSGAERDGADDHDHTRGSAR